MISVEFSTHFDGVPIDATLDFYGEPDGSLGLYISEASAANIDPFGLVKTEVANILCKALKSSGLPVTQHGTTLNLNIPTIHFK